MSAPFNSVTEAIGVCLKAAFWLYTLYAFCIALYFVWQWLPPDTGSIRDVGAIAVHIAQFYVASLIVACLGWMVAMVPVLITGVVGGGLIGQAFRSRRYPLPSQRALLYGGVLSLLLAIASFAVGIIVRVPLFFENLFDPLLLIFWHGPITLSFFGFWWTAYQVNRKLQAP